MPLSIESEFDLEDTPFSIGIAETGGNSFAVTLNSGRRFLTQTGAGSSGDFSSMVTSTTSFLTELETALNTGGAGASDYTVSLSASTGLITITHAGGSGVTDFTMSNPTNASYIGMHSTPLSGALSYEMGNLPYHRINSTIGAWSRYAEFEKTKDGAIDVVAHSGKPYGIAREVVPKILQMTMSMEPRGIVYMDQATTTEPWTWEHLFRHCRNHKTLAIDDGTDIHYTRLTAKGALFVPRSVATDYVGHWDIRLDMRLLARKDS